MITPTAQRTYKVGTVKPWVQTAADFLGNMFGFTTIGGYREQGSVPNSDHPKGLALDFMTNKPAQANELLQYAIAHAGQLGIHYLIYNRVIYTSENGFKGRPYNGPNPHTDHVHISFNASAPSGEASLVNVANVQSAGLFDPSSWPVIGQIEGAAEKLTSREWWLRLGYYFVGVMTIIFGIYMLFREPAEKGAQVAAKVWSLKGGGK